MARQRKAQAQIRDIASIINNESDRAKLKGFIDEAVRCHVRIADEQESVRGIREAATNDIGIDPKLFSNIVRVFRTDSFDKTKEEMTELETAIEMLQTVSVSNITKIAA